MIYVLQILSIQIAISLAKHDAPAVIHFENFGADPVETSRFHRYNSWVKFFFCCACCFIMCDHLSEWMEGIKGGILSFLWIYLVFDIALNMERSKIQAEVKRQWYYLGSHDSDGRRWQKWFKKDAGKWKAVIIGGTIAIINVLIRVL